MCHLIANHVAPLVCLLGHFSCCLIHCLLSGWPLLLLACASMAVTHCLSQGPVSANSITLPHLPLCMFADSPLHTTCLSRVRLCPRCDWCLQGAGAATAHLLSGAVPPGLGGHFGALGSDAHRGVYLSAHASAYACGTCRVHVRMCVCEACVHAHVLILRATLRMTCMCSSRRSCFLDEEGAPP